MEIKATLHLTIYTELNPGGFKQKKCTHLRSTILRCCADKKYRNWILNERFKDKKTYFDVRLGECHRGMKYRTEVQSPTILRNDRTRV